jgi:hypothetical protein
MYCYKKHAESGLLARGSLTPKGGLDPARRHFRPQWILLMAALFPGLLAALLSQQDLDTLALRGESTLFVALFLKWLVTIYLWTPMFLPTWLASRYLSASRLSFWYVGGQLIAGPFIAYLHIVVCYGILSRLAHTGPFTLRHPWVYYRSSRYLIDLVLYYTLVVCIHGSACTAGVEARASDVYNWRTNCF